MFYETVGLILEVINSQFDQDTLHLPKEIESILLPAARGNVSEILKQAKSFYSEDVDCKRLEHQLSMVKTAFKTPPENKIQAVVQALNVEMLNAGVLHRKLSDVDKLIKLYPTIPVQVWEWEMIARADLLLYLQGMRNKQLNVLQGIMCWVSVRSQPSLTHTVNFRIFIVCVW